jgi:hypothetical protein
MAKKSNFPIILTERQQYWLEHLRSCKAAGTSYSDYARSHGLNINTFYTMIRRLRRLGVAEKSLETGVQLFKKVSVQPTQSAFSEVKICFSNGICIELSTHFDAATLPVFLQTVAQLK